MLLRGTTVVELCPLFPGPLAGQILRQYGARVLKVVPRTTKAHHDLHIALPDFFLNDAKEHVHLDIADATDRSLLMSKLAEADVFLYGFRPGSLDKYGMGPWDLRRQFRDLIVCCLSGFGLDGTLSHRAGHDLTYLARSGVLGMAASTARTEQTGTNAAAAIAAPLPVQIADVAGGTYPCVMNILAALNYKQVHRGAASSVKGVDGLPGAGCVIDVSMTDNSHALLVLSEAIRAASGLVDVDQGRFALCGAAPCYNIYRTSDGRHLAVGALEEPYWLRVVGILNLPAEFKDPLIQLGLKDGDRCKAIMAERVAEKTLHEWVALFENVDAMVEPVLTPDEALATPLFQYRRSGHLHALKSRGVTVGDGCGNGNVQERKEMVDMFKTLPLLPGMVCTVPPKAEPTSKL